jgi:protein-tyrosine phosphatase
MAKVIFEQLHKREISSGKIKVDSAAYDVPSDHAASLGATNAIRKLYGTDLLQGHRPKKCTNDLMEWADAIVVMTGRMKYGMPPAKTKTLREYAGQTGDIRDPFMQSDEVYLQCATEIKNLLEIAYWSMSA